MAFAQSTNVTVNNSKFIDKSTITKVTSTNVKDRSGDGLQMLLNASSMDASFDSQARFPPPLCDENTRLALLEHIFRWINSGAEDILFLDGPAGAGKSAIAQTVAVICAERNILAASYFFFRGSPSQNTITPLIPTIAYHIAASTVRKRKKMKRVMKGDPSILEKSPEAQLHKLILEPYQLSLFQQKLRIRRKRCLLVIDGLDECIGDNQRHIVKLLSQLVDKERGIVRCLIASRPEPQIISAIGSLTTHVTVARITLNEESRDANGEIRIYLRSGFDKISSRMNVPQPWPSDDIIDTLTRKAGGIFIYASTILKYIDDEDYSPTALLEHVLRLPPGTRPFAEQDLLYQHILTSCPSQHHPNLLHILGFIFLRNPAFETTYDVSLIEAVLGLFPGEVPIVLRRMHSILTITATHSKHTISFLHPSFGDFIFNEERSGKSFIDRQRESLFLALKCIDYMGHRQQRELGSTSTGKNAIVYAWNSWSYHGIQASDSYFIQLVEGLRLRDKVLWTHAFPEDYHLFCVDGLDAGITWLEHHNAENLVNATILDLRLVKDELVWNFCTNIVANPMVHLVMLRVFEDPGVDFFDLDDDYLAVLDTNHDHLTALYFRWRGKVHGLVDRSLPSRIFHNRRDVQHKIIALHCIRMLRDTSTKSSRSPVGLRYATKYWAKHVSLSDVDDRSIFERLQQLELHSAAPGRRATSSDAGLVIHWLEKPNIPFSQQNHEVVSLWKGYRQMLQSDLSLGFYWNEPLSLAGI